VATAKDGDAPFAPVLEQSQLLGQGIDTIQRREIERPGHHQRATCPLKLAALPETTKVRRDVEPGDG
jgi:hypothetical protein